MKVSQSRVLQQIKLPENHTPLAQEKTNDANIPRNNTDMQSAKTTNLSAAPAHAV